MNDKMWSLEEVLHRTMNVVLRVVHLTCESADQNAPDNRLKRWQPPPVDERSERRKTMVHRVLWSVIVKGMEFLPNLGH